MKDLTTEEGREMAANMIRESFISALRDNGIELSDTATCRVDTGAISLGIAATGKYKEKGWSMDFSSEITLYAKREFPQRDNEINFGTSGVFTPKNQAPYWRTLHAASILKNWKVVCKIVNTHCEMMNDLYKEISKINS